MKRNLDEILRRMLKAGKLKNLSSLSRALDVAPQSISNYKKRGVIPSDLIVKFARLKGVSIDWLLTGRGAMELKTASTVSKALNQADDDHRAFAMRIFINREEKAYVEKLLSVLRGPRRYVAASIKLSIDSYLGNQTHGKEKTASAQTEIDKPA